MNPDEVLRVRTAAYKANRITGCAPMRKRATLSFICRPPPYRQLVNLDDLLKVLTKRRKVKVQREYLEQLSFGGQVRLFSQTDVAVGIHGAGFANIVFMMPKSCLVEFFNPFFRADYYRNMAKKALLYYLFIENTTVVNEGKVQDHRNLNIKVDVDYTADILCRVIDFVLYNKYEMIYTVYSLRQ